MHRLETGNEREKWSCGEAQCLATTGRDAIFLVPISPVPIGYEQVCIPFGISFSRRKLND